MTRMRKTLVCSLAGALLLSACATPQQGASAGQSAAGGAAVGALAGCALAALAGRDCAGGAAVGALVGAAFGWSSYSEKVASGQSVNAQARREGVMIPDHQIALQEYRVQPSASVARAGGEPLQVIGDIKLIGQSRYVPDVVQSMTLIKANGENASDTPQIAKVHNVDGAGHYRAVGVYKIPRGMEQGRYTVQSVLFLNGREVARRDISFQVAGGERQSPLAYAPN